METEIKKAVDSFEKLLREQIARAKKIKEIPKERNTSSKEIITIGLVDGDGIGPIIMKEAKKLLETLLEEEIASGKVVIKEIVGLTVENRQQKGEAVPLEILEEIKLCDVILKGPTTTPNGGTLESANVTLRRELDLFANVRPISIPDKNIDWTFFRENTEGEYVLGSKGIEIPELMAVDFKVITDAGTERIARAAFEYARRNGKKSVSVITKANIMKKTDGKFSKICEDVSREYPEIKTEEYYIDIMVANILNEDIRSSFEVFVMPNLYGDIITDEAAQIQGGVGTAGSANIGSQYAMFEAIHGSAPRLIEMGQAHLANPTSIIKAMNLMLSHIGFSDKAAKVERILNEKPMERMTCSEYGDYLISAI